MEKNEILSIINDGEIDELELLELVTDNDFDIALAVAKCSCSTEPILDIAAHDRDERIRFAVVNNPNCGTRTLEYLLRDNNPEIAALAVKHLNDKEKQKI